MLFLKSEGLIAPDEIATTDDAVPLDFTRLNNREIGSVHSRYAVRHAHALFVTARYATELAALQRDLRFEQAQYRHLHKGDYKTKYELDDAMALDTNIAKLEEQILEASARTEMLDALLKGYEDLFRAASREMTRRFAEVAPKD